MKTGTGRELHKVLIFTDLHIVEADETIIGLDPAERFASALKHALMRHPDARHVILTGDLTHHGRAGEYARLRALLKDCPVPVTATLGNHDRRAAYFAAFPEAAQDADGFAQGVIDAGPVRILVLDTLDETGKGAKHAGYLCEARLDWLGRQLRAAPDRPTMIALHHPPFVTGFDGMDRINLTNGAALLDLLSRHRQVTQLICGHVHRRISGNIGGLAWSVFKSPCHQMPMLLGAAGSAHSVDEPGAYGIALLHPGGIILHTEDVLEHAPVPLADQTSA